MFAITERLLLRPGWIEDAPALATAIADERIVPMLAQVPWPYHLKDAEWFLSRPDDLRHPNFLMIDRIKQPGRILGTIGFHDCEGEPEIGYWLVPDRWGEGIVVEAGHAALNAARASLGYRHFVSGHFVDNPRSGRVLRKLGFHQTAITPRYNRARGRHVDCVLFELDDAAAQEIDTFSMAPSMAA